MPAIAITYGGNKGDGIMNDLGLGNYATPIDAVTEKILIEKFQEISDGYDQIKSSILEKLHVLTAEKETIAQLLTDPL